MRSSSSLKATAAVAAMAAVVATAEAAAGSYYMPMPASPHFLLSPIFLWVTANVIIVWLWLVSSRRRGGRAANDDDDTAAHADGGGGEVDVVPGAVHRTSGFYASEYEAFSEAAAPARASAGGGRADDAPAPVSVKKLTREARAAARRSDRPRVRRKPELAGQDAPPTTPPLATIVAEAAHDEPPRAERRRRDQAQEVTTAPAVSVPAYDDAEPRPMPGGGGDGAVVVNDDDDDVSMDSLWASMVQRNTARPVVMKKSESWGNEELPRLQRVAEAAAARRQVRKSVSAVAKAAAAGPTTTQAPAPPPPSAAAARQTGWRTREVLVSISPDELLRRAESFIRRQREHLRLQRQESEQRQLLLQRRVHAPAPPLIRV